MNRVRYGLALLEAMLMPGALLYWFSIHPFVKFWRRVGMKRTAAIHLAMIGAVAYGIFLLRDRVLAVDYGTNWVLIAISIPVLVISLVLRRVLGRHLKLRILMGIPELAGEGAPRSLLRDGVYARIRHPRYLEIGIALVFYAMFTNYLASWVILAAGVPALLAIIHIEERELRDRFGEEYVKYCARVPRFWPRDIMAALPLSSRRRGKGMGDRP